MKDIPRPLNSARREENQWPIGLRAVETTRRRCVTQGIVSNANMWKLSTIPRQLSASTREG
jgi:hypothetical protein